MLTFITQILIASTAVLILAMAGLFILRRKSVSIRHAWLCSVMIALIVLPLLIPFLPVFAPVKQTLVIEETVPTVAPSTTPEPVQPRDSQTFTFPVREETTVSQSRAVSGVGTPAELADAFPIVKTVSPQETPQKINPITIFAVILCAGMMIRLVTLFTSMAATRRMAKNALVFKNGSGRLNLTDIRKRFRIRRDVPVLTHDQVEVPFAAGIVRPMIFLPGSMQNVSPEKLRLVLMHEMAHIARCDVLWQLLSRVMLVVYWFHPLAWWLANRIRREREFACDDAVLWANAQTPVTPEDYAMVLLDIAQSIRRKSVILPGCTVAMAQTHQTEKRIRAILDEARARKPISRLAAVLLIVGVCSLTAFAGMFSPFAVEEKIVTRETKVEQTTQTSDAQTNPENTDSRNIATQTVDLDKRVNLHGKAVGPDGKADLSIGAKLVVRALSADNEGNYFGDHTTVDTDGRFAYSAVCNLNYEMVIYDNAGKWASKPFYLELGEEAPEKEIVIELVQGSLVEGTALSLETGEALAGTSLLFFRYFEVPSKTDGTPRSFPVTHFISADENGKFQVAVTPGTYGVSTASQYTKLFFKPKEGLPEKIIRNSWDDETEAPFTVFAVSQGETVKPILRISEETLSSEVNMEKRVDVRGKVVLPEGGELRGRTSIMVRALSADNKSNYFGSHTQVNEDGTFVYHAVCNLNYMMTVRDEFGEWASEPVWLEVGNEPPQDEIVFTLVKGSVVEGTVLAQETGEPLAQVQLIFGQYFETKTKPEGEKRISLITNVFHTDSEGKFRKMVLPGEYGVATMSSAMSLFTVHDGFPENFFADNWDENKKMDHTAFRVKENETVRPILRLPADSDDVQTPMPIHGKVFGPGGAVPEKLTVHVRALSAENDTNMYASGGRYSDDGKILLMEPKNQNYMITVYDPENVWAAKPIMLEVGKEAPKDEFALHLEKGKLIEGTLLDHETGRPIPNHDILFFEYFDVISKRTGKTRTFPINSYGTTDAEGKFRRTVLPGKYGVCVYPAANSLFIPDMIKKATVTNASDWQKSEQCPATVFQVSDKDETVCPVLRISTRE